MKKYIEAFIHVLIWGISYFLILNYVSTISDFRKDQGPFWLAILFGMLMSQLLFYTTAFYVVPKYLQLKKILHFSFYLLCIFLAINIIETLIDYYWLVGFFSSESESLTSYFSYNAVSSFFILLLGISYALIKKWFRNEELKRILKEEKLTTEMTFLKSQINPHFLFNVLNSFYAKALKNNVPDLADGISKLADLMRYMVYETNEDKVTLEKEILHLKKFVQVYQLRIAEEDDVLIDFKIKGDIEKIKISPMLLIPFVENAIKHGVDVHAKSVIHIAIDVSETTVNYLVTNTVHKTKVSLKENVSGFGLDNLKKRLSILYPKRHLLETKVEDGYFISLLTLQTD